MKKRISVIVLVLVVVTTMFSTIANAAVSISQLPSVVDNSQLACFPPIESQGGLGSCAFFSTTYYQFTYMTGLVRNWDVKNDTSNTKKFSTKWNYNLINSGIDAGSFGLAKPLCVLHDNGAATLAEFPYDSNYKEWCLNSSVWKNALSYKLQSAGTVYVKDATSPKTPVSSVNDPDLTNIKNYLNNRYIFVFETDIYDWDNKLIGNDLNTSEDDDFKNKYICYRRTEKGAPHCPHDMTIVGYNDNVWVDINDNGIVDVGEKGAFKIANSWGTGDGDQGFRYVAYDALNEISSVTGAPTSGIRKGVFDSSGFQYVTAKESYVPTMLAKFTINHSMRKQIYLNLGCSGTEFNIPFGTYRVNVLNDNGGNYAFDGTGDGTGNTSVDGTFYVDLSEFISEYKLNDGKAKRWYLVLTDGLNDGKPLTVKNFSLTHPSGAVLASTGPISRTVDGGKINDLYLEYTFSGQYQDTWVNRTNAPISRAGAATTNYNNEIYVAGGNNEINISQKSLWLYNPAEDTWTPKADMAIARTNAGAATVLNKIYVVGGFNKTKLNSVEEYDPRTYTWTTKASMPTARSELGVVATNGKIYAIGGIDSNGATVNTVEEYDPYAYDPSTAKTSTTGVWKTKKSMPTARSSFGVVTYNGKIYVVGGNTGGNATTNVVEVYDPLNDEWNSINIAPMPTSRQGLSCTAFNGKIYAIGGIIPLVGICNKTEEYNPVTNTWTTKANLNNARTELSATCTNGKLYTIGGYNINADVCNKVEEYNPYIIPN